MKIKKILIKYQYNEDGSEESEIILFCEIIVNNLNLSIFNQN